MSPAVRAARRTDRTTGVDPVGAVAAPGRLSARRRARAIYATLVTLPLLATLTNSPGSYIADSRFEHYWASATYFARHGWLWDPFRALGRTAPYFAPGIAGALATLSGVGLGPPAAERVLHAAYLIVAALGMVALLRLFRPQVGLEHLLAGLAYAFSPFTSQFLLPSGLFLHHAIAPWLLVALGRGVRGTDRPWRWPAAAALAVLVVGTLNVPSLMYACVPLLPVAVYLVHVERSARWRDVAAWAGRTGVLVAIGSVAAVLQLRGNTPFIAENLQTTELPSTVGRTSSWAESWRGLGFWLSYFRIPGVGASRPEAAPYFDNGLVVLGTFVAPIVAVATLWWSRWRPRLLFGALLLVGLVLMVGIHPIGRPAPTGAALDWAFDHILVLRGLRSGYKAGPSFAIAIAALFGVGVADAARKLRASAAEARAVAGRAIARTIPVLAIAFLAIAAFPFWTGSLYSENDRLSGLPGYWQEALQAANALPDDGRVLVLPGAERNRYRWGYLGDDMFDALLDQPHVVRQSFAQGQPEVGSLLAALDERTANDRYQPGSFAPLARLLGIRWVLIRNDLDWQAMGAARPAQLDGLRADTDLHLIATFGAPGEGVSAPGDPSASVLGERLLPPIELYEVDAGRSIIQALPPGSPTLVSGDGEALPPLAADGSLGTSPGIRFTGGAAADALTAALEAGSRLVVTDSNRRRATQVTSSHNLTSYLLPAGASLDRQPLDLFSRPGSQTVATYGDAATITASGFGSAVARYQNWLRPANAFDGDPSTSWRVAQAADAVGHWLRVDLQAPAEVSEIELVPAAPEAARHITGVTIEFSDGSAEPVRLTGRASHRVAFPSRLVSWFRVRIDDVDGSSGAAVGFAEVTVRGLELAEVVQVPDDIFRAADRDPALAAALGDAPVAYSFERLQRLGGQDEELDVRRRFRTGGPARAYSVTGTLEVTGSSSDETVDALAGQPVGAIADDRAGDGLDGWAGRAIDGDEDTAWKASASAGHVLHVRFAPTEIDRVEVITWAGTGNPAASSITGLQIAGADGATAPCAPTASEVGGRRSCIAELPRRVRSSVDITITGIAEARGPFGALPVAVAEVRISGPDGAVPTLRTGAPLAAGCRPLASIDGRTTTATFTGSVADLVAGRPVPFTGCDELTLDAGWHELRSSARVRGALGTIRLDAGTERTTPIAVASVVVLSQTPAGADLRVDSDEGTTVVLGQSMAPGWQARIDGGTPVAAASVNGLSAWSVAAGPHRVEVLYRPQRAYELGLALLAAVVALCIVLVARRSAVVAGGTLAPGVLATRPAADPLRWRSTAGTVAVAVAAAVGGFLLGYLEGAVLATAAVVAVRLAGAELIGRAAAWLLVLAAAATLAVHLPQDSEGIGAFVSERTTAGALGRLAGVLVFVVVLVGVMDERRARVPRAVVPPAARPWSTLTSGWSSRVVPVLAAGAAASTIAALVGTRAWAVPVAFASFGAALVVVGLAGAERVLDRRTQRAASQPRAALRATAPVLQGSAWLIAGFLVQALTGTIFWLVAANTETPGVVGRATALFASLQFVNYATALGLQEVIGRFTKPSPDDADAIFGWSILATVMSSAIGTAVYVRVVGAADTDALPAGGWVGLGAIFLLLSAGAAIALLVDARLMTARRWRWVFGRLVVVGVVRIPLLLVPLPVDAATRLFLVIAAPIAISGLVGIVVLRRDEGVRVRLRPGPAAPGRAVHFAAASWLANLAQSAPQFTLPVIVLAHVSPEENANFFLAWSIAAFALILPLTIGRVLLAEGSRDEADLAAHADTARRLSVGLLAVAAVGAVAIGPALPRLYGSQYEMASQLLPLMVLGGIPWAISAVALAEARVRHDHAAAVIIAVVLAVTTVGTALVWVPAAGADGAVRSWLVGTIASTGVAMVMQLRSRRSRLGA